jgi:hypothetical protein
VSDKHLTREEFAALPGPTDRLFLPCDCGDDVCRGWVQLPDDPFDLRLWSEEQIADARAFRDRVVPPGEGDTP